MMRSSIPFLPKEISDAWGPWEKDYNMWLHKFEGPSMPSLVNSKENVVTQSQLTQLSNLPMSSQQNKATQSVHANETMAAQVSNSPISSQGNTEIELSRALDRIHQTLCGDDNAFKEFFVPRQDFTSPEFVQDSSIELEEVEHALQGDAFKTTKKKRLSMIMNGKSSKVNDLDDTSSEERALRALYPSGHPCKPLKYRKVNDINEKWFFKEDVKEGFPLVGRDYSIDHSTIKSLAPGEWVVGDAIDAYVSLLIDREERREFRVNNFFLPVHFVPILLPRRHKHQKVKCEGQERHKAWRIKKILPYKAFKSQPLITEAELIFIPTNDAVGSSAGSHWWLFVLDVRDWKLFLFDSMRDNKPRMPYSRLYKEQIYVVAEILPDFLRFSGRNDIPPRLPTLVGVDERPKQHK